MGSNTVQWRDYMQQSAAREVVPLDLLIATEWHAKGAIEIHVRIGNGVAANEGPSAAAVDDGVTLGLDGVMHAFTSTVTDPDGNDVYYQWEIDGGQTTNWIGPYSSGETCTQEFSWDELGDKEVTVRAKDTWGYTTDWSTPWTITIQCCAIRGDIDHSGELPIDIGDLVYLVDYMFTAGPTPDCWDEGDVDASGFEPIDIGDLVWLVDYMFTAGAEPPPCPTE